MEELQISCIFKYNLFNFVSGQAGSLHGLRARHGHHTTNDEGCRSANLASPPGCEEGECELMVQWSGQGAGRVGFLVSARLEGRGSVWAALGLSADGEHVRLWEAKVDLFTAARGRCMVLRYS